MEFDALTDPPGLAIIDPIEHERFVLSTTTPVSPTPTSTQEFRFPVSTAVHITTKTIEIPNLASIFVRRSDGTLVADDTAHSDFALPAGDYLIEVNSAPMAVYMRLESRVEITHTDTSTIITFEAGSVRIGARSLHERPEGTITVTDDIEDLMRAVSLFGSALKTTSPERSFPTLRGHPPRIERGDQFSVPAGIERPETDVKLVVPPDREHVYPAASLAYYLGADLVAGMTPRLLVEEDEYSLDGRSGYEETINRTLHHLFFLDCCVRSEGVYEVDVYERKQVEPIVPFDFEVLYDAPQVEQLTAYLSVPFDSLEPYAQDWHLTTDVDPVAKYVEALPYLAFDLSFIRTPIDAESVELQDPPEQLDEFFRGGSESDRRTDVYNVRPTDTLEHARLGRGYPVKTNKLTVDALQRRVDSSVPERSELRICVICNDQEMVDENIVSEYYGLRDHTLFDVAVKTDLRMDEVTSELATDYDLFHYIGHITDDGFLCRDGVLDAHSLDTVRVKAFLLNACQSYEQGMALLDAGSRGGVVTMEQVLNNAATSIGLSLARLLNSGFNLRQSLYFAERSAYSSAQYLVLGDGGLHLLQGDSGVLLSVALDRLDQDRFEMKLYSYLSSKYRMGTYSTPAFDSHTFLAGGLLNTYVVDQATVERFFEMEIMPVHVGTDIFWSDEIDLSTL